MASPTSDDRPVKSTNGVIERHRERVSAAARVVTDEQTLADAEQTLGETDQTLADADQTTSDSDQASADRDQFAADDDQVASDRDLAHGGDRLAHERSRDSRQQSAHQRELSATARVNIAKQRDVSAHHRDLGALARDQAADARDLAMAQRDAAYEHHNDPRAITGADIVLRAADQRKRAAKDRGQAAEYRVLAAQDRRSAADDRKQAARDRLQALADRDAFAAALLLAETDALTGVHTRAAGLRILDDELDRCRRSDGQLVACYVDVVGLKALNDSEGHGAGDALLKRVVTLIQARLRSYDLIIRLGGDEFLCAISSMTLPDARERFTDIAALLAASPADAGAIRTGFAQLTPDETAADLIARADGELLDQRN